MIRTKLRSFRPALLLLALLAVAACGADSTGPSRVDVAGDYTATALMIDVGGQSINGLAAGVTLDLTLNSDGTTTGRFFAPAEFNEPDEGDFEADLTGTWTLSGNTVTFQQNADTFVRDLRFTFRNDRLEADRTFESGTRIQVVLTKR
jgi:hypothetical protein